MGCGISLIKGLFNLTCDHPTLLLEMPAVMQPVTVTMTPQHPAQEHTGMPLVIVYSESGFVVCCAENYG